MTQTTENWIVHGIIRHGESGRTSCDICVRDDIKLLRECLGAICDQLPDGANLNPAARIMGVLTRLEKYIANLETYTHD